VVALISRHHNLDLLDLPFCGTDTDRRTVVDDKERKDDARISHPKLTDSGAVRGSSACGFQIFMHGLWTARGLSVLIEDSSGLRFDRSFGHCSRVIDRVARRVKMI
jgi:hypothetical protein